MADLDRFFCYDVDMSAVDIIPYSPAFRDQVIVLTVDAWSRVFPTMKDEVPGYVYDAFYPDGWQARQTADVATLLDAEPENFWLAVRDNLIAGYVGVRVHPDDRMGEIHIIAVAPDHQKQGIGQALMAFAEEQCRSRGMKMIMVETGGDSGHKPARRAYEAFGFQRWPVARYFKQL